MSDERAELARLEMTDDELVEELRRPEDPFHGIAVGILATVVVLLAIVLVLVAL